MNDDGNLQREERFKLLTEVSRESLMGRLLRSFWQPVALSSSLDGGLPQPLRILGDDLTLYRGESGKAYLVAGRCAHRLSLLHTGWIEGDEIRCIYHGWKYDGTGRCTERPAEHDKGSTGVKIEGYPAQEYAGLVFAYMGEGAPPPFELPRKNFLEEPGRLVFPREEVWPCHWFQHIENSLDAVHVSFVHRAGRIGTFGTAVTAAIPELEYSETESGIRQVATRGQNNVRVSDWTFPNNNHISQPGVSNDDPWLDLAAWMIPVDDTHTKRISVWTVPSSTPESDRRISEYFQRTAGYNPAQHHDDLIRKRLFPDDVFLPLTSAQDYVAQMGQGDVADRAHEWLGRSDAGVVLLRRLFWREMEAIRDGRATKQWRRLHKAAELPEQVGA
jgi:5,5'-dehydrodivanillate O-demethylase oxygenase subunit